MFANLKDGKLTVNNFRLPDAVLTTFDDLMSAYDKGGQETLTATIRSYELNLLGDLADRFSDN